MDFLDYALMYARKGLAVFPLVPKNKNPLTKNGFKSATTDEIQIKSWWQDNPNANIGIATGAVSNGLCVIDLDVDAEKGKDGYTVYRNWERTHGMFPPSAMSKTGRGGFHYFFRSDEPVKNRVDILPGIDVRGDGGYIVAPPSIHPNGNAYNWYLPIDQFGISSINDTLKYFLTTGETSAQQTYLAPDIIPSGERNHLIFKFACMMQAKGASDQTVFAATMSENQTKCDPPLSEKEVRLIVNSALKYEKGKPIYVSDTNEATQGRREPVFSLTKDGKIKNTRDNIREAIQFDETMWDSIRFNELSRRPYVYGKLPWDMSGNCRAWNNNDDAAIRTYLEKRYAFSSTDKIADALTLVAQINKFNPIVDILEDIYTEYKNETGAIRKLLPTYMGAEDSDYNFEVLKIFMLGAISRAYHPGCKFDYVMILYGQQGIGKSEFLRRLAIHPEWFNDNFNTFEGDKAVEKLLGMWMVEMAELKALKSAKDAESFKSFLTSRIDNYRVPYEKRTEQIPRMCVFAGTTNQKNVFVDKTGNRRFLPIICKKENVKINMFESDQINEDVKQAWGEAMRMFKEADGMPTLTLTPEFVKQAEIMQEAFSEDDYRVGVIQNWLDENEVDKVCVPQIIEYALGMEITKCNKMFKREISEIMDGEIYGWSKLINRDKGRTRFTKYGRQVTYIRDVV